MSQMDFEFITYVRKDFISMIFSVYAVFLSAFLPDHYLKFFQFVKLITNIR